jgi:hypothetical protein
MRVLLRQALFMAGAPTGHGELRRRRGEAECSDPTGRSWPGESPERYYRHRQLDEALTERTEAFLTEHLDLDRAFAGRRVRGVDRA